MNISLLLRNSTTMAMALASPASAASSSSSSPSSSSSANGQQQETKRYVQEYLTNCKSFYSCIYCRTHLANHDELVSRSFQGNRGRAYLFNSVINISCGPAVQRELNTGAHAVADIYCSNCETTLGWKYEKAYVKTQKYKEGKYIIELAHVVRENRHLELDKRDLFLQKSQNIHNRNQCYNQQERSISHSISSASANKRDNPSSPSSVDSAIAASPSSLFSSSPRSTTSSSASASTSSSPSSPPASFSSPAARPRPTESNLNASIQSDNNNIFNSNNASIRDLIDDDLMFPYYDDLCIEDDGRVSGSFVGSFSSACLHNRIRRSLYLDSKPYDWKYSTRSISGQAAADGTKQPGEEEEREQTKQQQQQQRDNNNSPKLLWQHQAQATDTASSEGSSQQQQQQQSINFSGQSMTDKRYRGGDEDDIDSGNISSGDEQVKSSDNNNDTAQRGQQLQQQQLKRDQVDESEIQFNFEADNIIAEQQQHINYSQQVQQNHQVATAMSNSSRVEHRRPQFAQQNNNKPICDQRQQQLQPQQTSIKGDEFESNVQAGNCALTSNGNNSGNSNDNNNNYNDNNINAIKQCVGWNSNLVATASDQKSNLDNKPPKLDDQTSAAAAATATGMSNSFSFDDEEFYDCYTS